MPKFRKKPSDAVIEADQWFDGKAVAGVHGGAPYQRVETAIYPEGSYPISGPSVVTQHGQVTPIKEGDWILPEPDGIHFYPVKPDIFTERYEEVVEGVSEKTLHNSDVSGARQNVPDIKVVGDGDMFKLLCKASSQSEGWMKSTKAMPIADIGCVVQVTTQQKNPDGSYSVAEAVTFVPGVRIVLDEAVGGRKLETFN
jgi:hypothetical protein